jgi:signal transduction histidine kinase
MAGGRTGTDWVVDIAAFAFALAVGATVLVTTRASHSDLGWLVDLTLGLVSLVAMWWRRRHPAALGVGIGLLSIVSALAAGPAVVVTFTATVRCARRPLAAVWAVAVLAAVTFPLVYPSQDSYALEVVIAVLFLAVVFGWGLYARARHQLLLSLRERAESLEAEQGMRVEQARAAERRRVAREMHDVLAHRLSLLSLHAGALEYRADASPDEVRQAAGVIRDASHAALAELREVIGVLREGDDPPATAPPQPTLEQVGALVDEARAAGGHDRRGAHGDHRQPPARRRAGHAPAARCRHRPRRAARARRAGRRHPHSGADDRGDFVLRARLPWAAP